MRIAIYSDPYKDIDYRLSTAAACKLVELGRDVIISHPVVCPPGYESMITVDEGFLAQRIEHLGQSQPDPSLYEDCEMILSFGGDGTFLATAHKAYRLGIPLVGVNLGSLGFMTEIDPIDLDAALEQIDRGDYEIEERMTLDVRLETDGSGEEQFIALNDAVVSRGTGARILSLELYLDGRYIETIQCDGVIVSTPTGSTGYAMAAGGPIVDPTMELLQITPICPHSLHSRTYVVRTDEVVGLRLYQGYRDLPPLSIDGRNAGYLEAQRTWVNVCKGERPVKIAVLKAQDFFRELPDKLRGRGK